MAFTTEGIVAETIPVAAPPKAVKLPPREWIKQNLFSSPFNSVLTVLFGAGLFFAWRGLLSFMFSHERSWDAVATNLKLLFTAAYPPGSVHPDLGCASASSSALLRSPLPLTRSLVVCVCTQSENGQSLSAA